MAPRGGRPYTVILAGGIGSGKSTAGKLLEELGCARIDLDELSRLVLEPGSPVLSDIAFAFGSDLLDEAGVLNRALLATRAFATQQDTARLEALELPAITSLLREQLDDLALLPNPPACCVVEVPLLDRLGDAHELADEVMVVWCPLDQRRVRAQGRGMTAADFDARARRQPSDAWLKAHADTLIDNTQEPEMLSRQLEGWYRRHEEAGWT